MRTLKEARWVVDRNSWAATSLRRGTPLKPIPISALSTAQDVQLYAVSTPVRLFGTTSVAEPEHRQTGIIDTHHETRKPPIRCSECPPPSGHTAVNTSKTYGTAVKAHGAAQKYQMRHKARERERGAGAGERERELPNE